MNSASISELKKAITAVETSYEFMLAYAAQGRDVEDSRSTPSIRGSLTTLSSALTAIIDLVTDSPPDVDAEGPVLGDFADVLRMDAHRARAAVLVALSVPSIGSQVVDNLNASIHLRALLTDLFLVDEAIKSAGRTRSGTS